MEFKEDEKVWMVSLLLAKITEKDACLSEAIMKLAKKLDRCIKTAKNAKELSMTVAEFSRLFVR